MAELGMCVGVVEGASSAQSDPATPTPPPSSPVSSAKSLQGKGQRHSHLPTRYQLSPAWPG